MKEKKLKCKEDRLERKKLKCEHRLIITHHTGNYRGLSCGQANVRADVS